MNREIIRRWNEKVKPNDVVYHLGDFCFERDEKTVEYYKEQLNGEIVIIRGNHDDKNEINSLITSLVINYFGWDIFMTHDPENIPTRYRLNFCGHVHEKWCVIRRGRQIIVNVGVDQWDFRPISFQEVIKMLVKEKYL